MLMLVRLIGQRVLGGGGAGLEGGVGVFCDLYKSTGSA